MTLGYDPASNVTAITDAVTANLSETYQYDLVGRVKQGTGLWGSDNYTYDAMGNRLTRSLVNGSTVNTSYTYTSTKTQLASTTTGGTTLSYTYAADGSLTARKLGNTTQASWTYNTDGRLLSAGGASLKYNAFGQRAVETVTGGGTRFVFSPDGSLLAEHTTGGARVRDYIYLNGQPLAVIDAAGAISYILNDQIGQPHKMLNAAGTITWQRNSGIFGDTVSQPAGTAAAMPQRFPGQQFDPYMALHYNYYRDYDPATGRYIEADPIGLAGGVNLYAYVGGNPIVRTDPLGLACNGAGCYTTPAESAAARGGNYDRYYQLACAGGDAYACYARHIAANDNTSGHLANWWLDGALDDLEDEKSQCIDRDRLKRNIRKGLAERYANYLPQDANRRRWPSKQGVSQIHWDEFGEHGLPPNTFGGTPFGKNGPYAPFVDWCPNCR